MFSMGMKGTKWRIFTTAIEMFAEKSYDTVSLRDIAKNVGIKASSIYNHFESKEELLSIVLKYFEYYSAYSNPDIEELLIRIGEDDPMEILEDSYTNFEPAIIEIMNNILVIAFTEMRHNAVAERLIYTLLIETPNYYLTTLLNRMIDVKVIEPLDVEMVAFIYSNMCYASAARWNTMKALDHEDYRAMHNKMLNYFIKPLK